MVCFFVLFYVFCFVFLFVLGGLLVFSLLAYFGLFICLSFTKLVISIDQPKGKCYLKEAELSI